ncbi:MAG: hypothetical protein LUF02_10020 [Erysipelotrichaceae bacterium]|nr:hypothetical protein [Erysipelotrichaceae bacterium]
MKQKIFYYIKIVIAILLILFMTIGMATSIINNTVDIYDIIGAILILIVAVLLYSAYKNQPDSQLYISPVAIKIIVVVAIICVVSAWSGNNSNDNDETYESDCVETNVDYDVLYKSFIESLKANASKHNLNLYNIDVNEDNHVITVYIDNYQGDEISSNDDAYEAIYNYASQYIDLDADIEVTIQFGNVINNQSQIYTIDDYYKVSYTKNVNGYYFLRANNVVKYQSEELNTLYDKDVTYSDLLSILNKNVDDITDSGIEIADFSTIHDYEVEGIYDIKQYGVYKNNGSSSDYSIGDYSNAYDFYYENQDTLSEDEAYEIYYNEYGEYEE